MLVREPKSNKMDRGNTVGLLFKYKKNKGVRFFLNKRYVSKYARHRKNKLIKEKDIKEELSFIDDSRSSYVTRTGKIYTKYEDGLYIQNKTRVTSTWYCYVVLVGSNTPTITKRVHRLVAIAFIPNSHNYHIVGHKDNNKASTNANNLYWTTYSENPQRAHDDKLIVNDKGYDDSQSYPVIAFKNGKEYNRYGSVSICANDVGVSKSTILRWCNNEINTHSRQPYTFEFDKTTKQ